MGLETYNASLSYHHQHRHYRRRHHGVVKINEINEKSTDGEENHMHGNRHIVLTF